jgi:hypothetical protein
MEVKNIISNTRSLYPVQKRVKEDSVSEGSGVKCSDRGLLVCDTNASVHLAASNFIARRRYPEDHKKTSNLAFVNWIFV